MKAISVLTGLLIAGSLTACTPPTMVVPGDVLSMQADQIVATERKKASGAFVNESFKLGQYEVKDVDRDWDSTKSAGFGSFSKEKTTSGYSYLLKTESGEMKGSCLIEGNEKGISFGGGMSMSKSVSKFGCSCNGSDGTAEVVLDSNNDSKYEGTVKTRAGEYTIKAIYEANGSLPTGNPSGYRVDSEKVIAAADVLHPGKLWLGKELSNEDRDDLTCIFTGLMLYQGKKESF
ncbi:MAG: hypothetical protein JXR91_05960 [Deltaproteobacteria bacterium]|nr:hypothetical protein [Deltaproteobacteria bacterium]